MITYQATPDFYDYISHHGVKGQKWGVRKKVNQNLRGARKKWRYRKKQLMNKGMTEKEARKQYKKEKNYRRARDNAKFKAGYKYKEDKEYNRIKNEGVDKFNKRISKERKKEYRQVAATYGAFTLGTLLLAGVMIYGTGSAIKMNKKYSNPDRWKDSRFDEFSSNTSDTNNVSRLKNNDYEEIKGHRDIIKDARRSAVDATWDPVKRKYR